MKDRTRLGLPDRSVNLGQQWLQRFVTTVRAMQDDQAGAITDLEACLRENPDVAPAWSLLGEVALRFGSEEHLLRALNGLRNLDEPAAQRLQELGERKGVLRKRK